MSSSAPPAPRDDSSARAAHVTFFRSFCTPHCGGPTQACSGNNKCKLGACQNEHICTECQVLRPRSSFDAKPNDNRCTVCKACAIKKEARNAKSNAARDAATAALNAAAAAVNSTIYDTAAPLERIKVAAAALRTSPLLLEALGPVGDGKASRNFFGAAFPGNISETDAWAEIVNEAPSCFKNRGTGGGETPCIRPRAGGFFGKGILDEYEIIVLGLSDYSLNATGSSGVEGGLQRIDLCLPYGSRLFTNVMGPFPGRPGFIYATCMRARHEGIGGLDCVVKPAPTKLPPAPKLLPHASYLADLAAAPPDITLNLAGVEFPALLAAHRTRNAALERAYYLDRTSLLRAAGSPWVPLLDAGLLKLADEGHLLRAVSLTQAAAINTSLAAGTPLPPIGEMVPLASSDAARNAVITQVRDGSRIATSLSSWTPAVGVARVFAEMQRPAAAASAAASAAAGSQIIVRIPVPRIISTDLVFLNVGGCKLLEAADAAHTAGRRAGGGKHGKSLAAVSAALKEHHVHGAATGYEILYRDGVWSDEAMRYAVGEGELWDGVFEGTGFASTVIRLGAYKKRIEALGGKVVEGPKLSAEVGVLISADPGIGDAATAKMRDAIARKLVIINGAALEAALAKAEATASASASTVVSEAASKASSPASSRRGSIV